MSKINIKCNFPNIFAQFSTMEEIKEVANNICAQVKNAYDARAKELSQESEIEAVVEVEAEIEDKPTSTKKASSKIERAKEIAAKMKGEAKKDDKKEVKAETKKEAKKETKSETKKEAKAQASDDTLLAVTDMAEIKKLGLTFEKYNDRCYVLRGNTKPLRKVLKEEFKGVFNGRLTGGEGWVISSKHAQDCAKALGLKMSA